jgi:hypothetical protein
MRRLLPISIGACPAIVRVNQRTNRVCVLNQAMM